MIIQVQQADERTRSVAGSKLSVIAEQIQFLQQQAAKILEETRLNAELNHAACNMVKKPGTVYHLYQRDTGQKYWLNDTNEPFLSEEWGVGPHRPPPTPTHSLLHLVQILVTPHRPPPTAQRPPPTTHRPLPVFRASSHHANGTS